MNKEQYSVIEFSDKYFNDFRDNNPLNLSDREMYAVIADIESVFAYVLENGGIPEGSLMSEIFPEYSDYVVSYLRESPWSYSEDLFKVLWLDSHERSLRFIYDGLNEGRFSSDELEVTYYGNNRKKYVFKDPERPD